jgi:hypothetical protein
VHECAERAARFELWQLAVVADEHELAVGALDVVKQLRELPRADHRSLVDHQHAPGRQPPCAAREVAEERDGAGAGDAGAGFEFARGAPRNRDAEHRIPDRLPRLAGGTEGVGLAGPRLARDDRDAVAAEAQPFDHAALFDRQRRPAVDGAPHRLRVGHTGARSRGRHGALEEVLLASKQLRSRVAELVARERQQPPVAASKRRVTGQHRHQRRVGRADVGCYLVEKEERSERRARRLRVVRARASRASVSVPALLATRSLACGLGWRRRWVPVCGDRRWPGAGRHSGSAAMPALFVSYTRV